MDGTGLKSLRQNNSELLKQILELNATVESLKTELKEYKTSQDILKKALELISEQSKKNTEDIKHIYES